MTTEDTERSCPTNYWKRRSLTLFLRVPSTKQVCRPLPEKPPSRREGSSTDWKPGEALHLFRDAETVSVAYTGSRTVELCCKQAVCGEVWLSSKPPCAWGKPSLCLFGRTDRRQAGRDRQQARRGFVSSHLYSSQAAGQNLKKVVSWQRGDRRSTELGYRPERDVDSGKLYNRILYRPKKVSGIVKKQLEYSY